MEQFTFMGFPPIRSSARDMWFRRLAEAQETVVLFEAPHRFKRLICDLTKYIGGSRAAIIGRELTKAHEEVVECPISEAESKVSALRGEFVVLIPPAKTDESVTRPMLSRETLAAEVGQLIEHGGVSRRDALRSLAVRYGVSVNRLYKLLEDPAG